MTRLDFYHTSNLVYNSFSYSVVIMFDGLLDLLINSTIKLQEYSDQFFYTMF